MGGELYKEAGTVFRLWGQVSGHRYPLQQAILMGKERELRERLRMERDKEIEVVITRLEQETASVKEESEKAAESKIR